MLFLKIFGDQIIIRIRFGIANLIKSYLRLYLTIKKVLIEITTPSLSMKYKYNVFLKLCELE